MILWYNGAGESGMAYKYCDGTVRSCMAPRIFHGSYFTLVLWLIQLVDALPYDPHPTPITQSITGRVSEHSYEKNDDDKEIKSYKFL